MTIIKSLKPLLNIKVVKLAFLQSILMFLCALMLTFLGTIYEEKQQQKVASSLLLQFKDSLTKELYINSVINNKLDTNLPAFQNYKKALTTAGVNADLSLNDCHSKSKQFDDFITPNKIRKCLGIKIKATQKYLFYYLLIAFILIGFFINIPIYKNLISSVKKENFRKMRDEIYDEVRHDISSPLITLENIAALIKKDITLQDHLILDSQIHKIRHLTGLLTNGTNHLDSYDELRIHEVLQKFIRVKNCELVKCSKKVNLIMEMSEDSDYSFHFKRNELTSILSNIVNNAVNASVKAVDIYLSYKSIGPNLIITIEDNGNGICPEQLPLIFQNGYSAGEQGTGKGLYFAKKKIEQMNGSIFIESKPKVGTIVTISLPIANYYSELNLPESSVVLLDDDQFLLKSFTKRISAEFPNTADKVFTFSSVKDLLNARDKYKWINACYILDCQINNNNNAGLDLAKDLLAQGEENISIHSELPYLKLEPEFNHIRKNNSDNLIKYLRQHVVC